MRAGEPLYKDECAFKAIRAELKQKGYKRSLLSLLKNAIVEEDQYWVYGRASFQVTLIQDPPVILTLEHVVTSTPFEESTTAGQDGTLLSDTKSEIVSQFADAESSQQH